MAIAFASFDEPHAWLLRGLVEYGWADWSRLRGQLPPGSFGGIDLGPWTEGDGRDGIPLVVPAQVQGQRCVDDGTYSFTVQVQRRQGGLAVVVRCPEANFFQEFPYDPYNPLWAAGYVHQALLTYVPQYVSWRLAGGELGWAELGEANVCSAVPACAESRSVCCHGIASGGATAGVPKVAASKPCDVLAVPGTGEGSTWKKPDCGAS
jgi:hypothetical protein